MTDIVITLGSLMLFNRNKVRVRLDTVIQNVINHLT